MPYDPRMLQMAQQGVRMMSPQQRDAFAEPDPRDPRSNQQQPPQQPRQWYDQAVQVGQPANQAVNMPDNQGDRQRHPPSLLDLMMMQQYNNRRMPNGPPGQQQSNSPPWWLGLGGVGGGTPR